MIEPIKEFNIKEDLDARVVKMKAAIDKELSTKIFNVVEKEIE